MYKFDPLPRRRYLVPASGVSSPATHGQLERLCLLALLAVALLPGAALQAQIPNRIAQAVDPARVQALPDHHPLWAIPANNLGPVPAGQTLEQMTLVLARSPQQEQAFENLLAAQQDPSSPEYHQWLTPAEIGERFGLSDADIATLTGWLQSQGLHVNWISPSRTFIGFGGAAADIGRAFQTELRYYNVSGRQRMAPASDPLIPEALAPAIQAVRGLYTIEDRPFHHLNAPQMTVTNGSATAYYIAPADFDKIYDVPASLTGAGQTIGIVAESRTDFTDFTYFRSHTGATFPNPTEVIPTAYGGVDPGPAYTSPPASSSTDDQAEATLDVFRAGSVAPGASLLLVAASSASGGIEDDAQYLIESTPVPAQIINISFGACESEAGSSGVSYWNTLFEQAAAEGISVFVSSGDSGASGCDDAFTTPPASPAANSPNYICSSSYATCVGGTEFNDAANPSEYWSSADGTGLLSVLGYIPEGGWNEPGSGSATQVAASGGGVSAYVATPSWQTGTGVPSARAGRYTPDVSFSSSCHDGYFGCLAAGGATCVPNSGGSYTLVGFCGTSAAAPGMAGVAALLNQKLGTAQGSLNPDLYKESSATPTAFHDTTVATSGVTSCSVNTPSMCNNSIPSPTSLTGGRAGYLLTTGYDEVTGLGSLDVQTFLDNFKALPTPTVTLTLSSSSITATQTLTVTIAVSGGSGNPTPTGSVLISSGSYTSAAATLASGSAKITIPAGALATGTDTLTASYTPDSSSSSIYSSTSGTHSITVTGSTKTTPAVSVSPSASPITTVQALTVTVTVAPTSGNPTPTGSVTLTSGSYTSASTTLAGGSAKITVAAGSLAVGIDTLTAAYTPDSTSSSTYNSSTGTATVTVTTKETPSVTVSPSASSITTAQSLTATITLGSSGGYGTPTGSVTLKSGSYTSAATTLASGAAKITVTAGSLAEGTDTLTATYTPDSTSSLIYNSASGTRAIAVTNPAKSTPAVSVSPSASSITTAQPLTVIVTVPATSGNSTPTGSVTLSSGSYTSAATALTSGTARITVAAGLLATGTDTLTAIYTPDSSSSSTYNSAAGTGTVTVTPKETPAVTVSLSASSITTAQSLAVTITLGSSGGYGTPTGSVKISSGSYASATTTLASGSAKITIPAGSLATGTDAITATYTPDTTSSPIYSSASGTKSVTVTNATVASFTIAGTSLSFSAGATTANTSAVTVTPMGGFTGSIALSAQITSAPANAVNPTFSFGSTSPVVISGTTSGNATLTFTTSAGGSSCAAAAPAQRGFPWYPAGGATLACVLLFGIPARRRHWQTFLGMIALGAFLVSGLVACTSSQPSTCNSGGSTDTTTGRYLITVTGTSGSITETSVPITINVQ